MTGIITNTKQQFTPPTACSTTSPPSASSSAPQSGAVRMLGALDTTKDTNGVNNNNNNIILSNNNNNTKEMNGAKTSSGSRRSRYDPRYVDVIRERPIRVTAKVLVPVREHPKFNFVGKLLGPKGNSMKRLQEETLTKMAVLGRGSMRDKQKEEELRASGDPKYLHLLEDLHVEITAFAPPAEAHARLAYSLAEIRRYLVPDNNDDIRRQQIREMEYMGGDRSKDGSVKDGGDTLNGHGGGGRMEMEGRAMSPTDLLRTDPGSPTSPSSLPSMAGLPPLHHHLPPLHHRSRSAHSPLGRALPPPPPHHPALPHPSLGPPHPHDLPPPARLLPPWGCTSSRRRVLSILDKAKMALDSSYEEEGCYSDYFYDDFDEYGSREDYADLYPPDCYDGGAVPPAGPQSAGGAGGWQSPAGRYKPLLPSSRDRARCRSSPYSRPK